MRIALKLPMRILSQLKEFIKMFHYLWINNNLNLFQIKLELLCLEATNHKSEVSYIILF